MTRLFDYSAWVRRAQQFVLALEGRPGFTVVSSVVSPPLERMRVDALARRLDQPVPGALRLFLQLGAAGLDCRYTFECDDDDEAAVDTARELFPFAYEIYGGACIGPAHELPGFAHSCAEQAKVFLTDHDSDKADEWEAALPVIAIGDGDYIALEGNTIKDPDDPPVLYLSNDGDDELLAESFTAFLTTWERLCYIGPEFPLLERLRDAGEGFLDPDSPEADQLRHLLGVPNVGRDR